MRSHLKLGNLWRQISARAPELGVLAAIFIVAATSFAFLKLVSEMREGDTHAIDRAILLALREPGSPSNPIGPHWLESVCRDLTSLGSPTVLALITLAVVGYLWVDRKRAVALFVVVALAGGAVLESVLKLGFARPRPELVSHLVSTSSFSFPSGHAIMATITYLTLGVLLASAEKRRPVKLYLLASAAVLAFLIGLTRIYLGVHWPTDVLAGWCVGTAWALGCWLIAVWLQNRGTAERTLPSAD